MGDSVTRNDIASVASLESVFAAEIASSGDEEASDGLKILVDVDMNSFTSTELSTPTKPPGTSTLTLRTPSPHSAKRKILFSPDISPKKIKLHSFDPLLDKDRQKISLAFIRKTRMRQSTNICKDLSHVVIRRNKSGIPKSSDNLSYYRLLTRSMLETWEKNAIFLPHISNHEWKDIILSREKIFHNCSARFKNLQIIKFNRLFQIHKNFHFDGSLTSIYFWLLVDWKEKTLNIKPFIKDSSLKHNQYLLQLVILPKRGAKAKSFGDRMLARVDIFLSSDFFDIILVENKWIEDELNLLCSAVQNHLNIYMSQTNNLTSLRKAMYSCCRDILALDTRLLDKEAFLVEFEWLRSQFIANSRQNNAVHMERLRDMMRDLKTSFAKRHWSEIGADLCDLVKTSSFGSKLVELPIQKEAHLTDNLITLFMKIYKLTTKLNFPFMSPLFSEIFAQTICLKETKSDGVLSLSKKRDCFSHEIVGVNLKTNKLILPGAMLPGLSDQKDIVIDWCFINPPEDYPNNIRHRYKIDGVKLFPVGVKTHFGVFSASQMDALEENILRMEERNMSSLKVIEQNSGQHETEAATRITNTFHVTNNLSGKSTRTKMFFNYRYIWPGQKSKSELTSNNRTKFAHGIRADSLPAPEFLDHAKQTILQHHVFRLPTPPTKSMAVKETIDAMVFSIEAHDLGYAVPECNVNSVAVNIYKDGSVGLYQHFDDSKRFGRHIISLRLFSDSRLSFGCKTLGMGNGTFTVDMPRGSVQVLDNASYAGRVVKHCIRPADLSGINGVLLLREIRAMNVKAAEFLEEHKLSLKFSGLSV